jgi:isopentenyldiphosphate isomerase
LWVIGYHHRIAECNTADLAEFEPWLAGGEIFGFVRRDRTDRLLATGSAFRREAGALTLSGSSPDERSHLLAELAVALERQGEVSCRGELYRGVRDFEETPRFVVDRGVVPWLGVRSYGVHLTCYLRRDDELFVWLAIRSPSKAYGGLWDNTVAGGQPAGLRLRDNLRKECLEEASIPPDLSDRAKQHTTIRYVHADAAGLKPDTLFCFDLELPVDFVPSPHDGEVEQFQLVPASYVAAQIREHRRCKPNCNLVWIDFLLRHGVLDAELPEADRIRLAESLQRPLP